MTHNFKKQEWSGSLEELFEECFLQGPTPAKIIQMSQFVLDGLSRSNELLPIRKFNLHPNRGQTFMIGSTRFMPVDNEPLIGLLNICNSKSAIPDSFSGLFKSGALKGSWKFDFKNDPQSADFKTGGVSADFRSNGLKVAHIEDAAEHIAKTEKEYSLRYLRSMMPCNVFLFPSPRCCEMEIFGNDFLKESVKGDWAEDERIRALAFEFLRSRLNNESFESIRRLLSPTLQAVAAWENVLKGSFVRVVPKRRRSQTAAPLRKKEIQVREEQEIPSAMRKILLTEAKTRSFDSILDELRTHRTKFQNTTWLSGDIEKSGQWVRLNLGDVFIDGKDDFTCKSGLTFKGSEYNGIHIIQGDAKWEMIDELLNIFDATGVISDVLVPSATWEHDTIPLSKKTGLPSEQSPRLALNGFDGIKGFFLYKRN